MIDFKKMLEQEEKQKEQEERQNNKRRNQMTENTANSEKKYANYNGKVQEENNGNRADVGKVLLWNNTEPTSEKSPLMTGIIEISIPEINAKRTYRVALWKNTPRQQNSA